MSHKCEQTETLKEIFAKLDNLLVVTTKVDQAICGNGVPGLHSRVTKLEGGLYKVAMFACAVGIPIGTIIGIAIAVTKIG